MRSLDDLVRAGKILLIALSDTPAWIVAEANMLAREHGWTQIRAYQEHTDSGGALSTAIGR